MLPVNPPGFGNSPYSACSAFAGNPLLIDLAALVADGLLDRAALSDSLPAGRVDFAATRAFRERHLCSAWAAFSRLPKRPDDYDAFCARNDCWFAKVLVSCADAATDLS